MPHPAIIIIVALKFFVPALLLYFPFAAAWGNYFLDIVDGDILQALGMSDPTYQNIDKAADWISYVFMLIVGCRWRIKKTIVVLFIYRTVGQALFFLTHNELMFFYFQNFLEPLVLIYTLFLFKTKSEAKSYALYKKHFKLVWGIILAYKMWNEWYLHFANIDLSSIFLGINGGS